MKKWLVFLWAFLTICLAACAAPDAGGDALVSLPTAPAQTSAMPEASPTPADTPASEESSAPVQASATPEATPAPEATPTPEAAPSESAPPPETPEPSQTPEAQPLLPEDGTYTSKEDVALYLHQYGHLPDNFITKKEAQALGWPGGSLEPYAPGKCIGGDRFGNYEGNLPAAKGRTYRECDIDTLGAKSRGAKRIIWSSDGLIYYTGDHYESFELLYGEE